MGIEKMEGRKQGMETRKGWARQRKGVECKRDESRKGVMREERIQGKKNKG